MQPHLHPLTDSSPSTISSRSSSSWSGNCSPVKFTAVRPKDDPTPPLSLPLLLGRSNYEIWKAAVTPILFADDTPHITHPVHPRSAVILLGGHREPRPPLFQNRPTKDEKRIAWAKYEQEEKEFEIANHTIIRFIRSTLAFNVQAFVRSITTAKDLWVRLKNLYGERAGINDVGGRYGDLFKGTESSSSSERVSRSHFHALVSLDDLGQSFLTIALLRVGLRAWRRLKVISLFIPSRKRKKPPRPEGCRQLCIEQ